MIFPSFHKRWVSELNWSHSNTLPNRAIFKVERSLKNALKLKSECHSNIATYTWWRHQMEKISALLAFCAENSPVPGEFPTQKPVTRSFEFSFDLRPNKRLSKQSWGWWYETPSSSLWCHRNVCPIFQLCLTAGTYSHFSDTVIWLPREIDLRPAISKKLYYRNIL